VKTHQMLKTQSTTLITKRKKARHFTQPWIFKIYLV